MIKKVLNILKKNFIIIMCIVIFILFCVFIKDNYMNIVNKIDANISTFFTTKMVNSKSTEFMKNITNMGDYLFIGLIFILCIIVFKNKIVSIMLSLDLFIIGFMSLALKLFFSRTRPANPLITLPNSYSFPSGHTMFTVGFYGLIIYFIWRTNIKKIFKYILTFIISMIIIYVCISRIYLGVHYFSDVMAGFIYGILILVLIINTYLNFDWRWKKWTD